MLMQIIVIVQFFFSIVIGIYFFNQLKAQRHAQKPARRDHNRELEALKRQRSIRLSEPLSERVRPRELHDIVGQEDGIRSLEAILCGPNPQHVIIYGPPGVGKTCAARLMLEKAKHSKGTPFQKDAKFIEMDATCVRFDERSIADPLIGSVHDPIYQGAGPLGIAGIPQPKPGAVTRAHGGVLFLDEIGELHPIQMNKLLKVLEDRRVFLESAYYDSGDPNTPQHIHDIFTNGLPADFRLIGATTRQPRDIPAAIRSRCMEVFFRPLLAEELADIARNAAHKVGFEIEDEDAERIGRYSEGGREAVNIVQMAAGIAQADGRSWLRAEDIDWVLKSGQYVPRLERKVSGKATIGVVNGLAVGGSEGAVLEIEVVAVRVNGEGRLIITGVVEEEELGGEGHKLRRRSNARASVDNVLTVLAGRGLPISTHDIHINFPGGAPVDGPSAGCAIALAVTSAILRQPVDGGLALTGELSVRGEVRPVGGVPAKVDAAVRAGAKRVLIPRSNWQSSFAHAEAEIIAVDMIDDVFRLALVEGEDVAGENQSGLVDPTLVVAQNL